MYVQIHPSNVAALLLTVSKTNLCHEDLSCIKLPRTKVYIVVAATAGYPQYKRSVYRMIEGHIDANLPSKPAVL